MILDNTAAGPGLKLWSPLAAIDRMQWEDRTHVILTTAGFHRVYTPYIFKKELQEKYKGWVKDSQFSIIKEGEDEEKYNDCVKYAYLGDKRLCHLEIFNFEPHSYTALPQRYFEIVEDYRIESGRGINELSVLLTEVCEVSAVSLEITELCKQIDFLETDTMRIVRPVDMISGKTDAVQYMASTNAKEDACLILARLIFQWAEEKSSG